MDGAELIVRVDFASIEAKDAAAVMNRFTDIATLFDPHFSEPRVVGETMIAHTLCEPKDMDRSAVPSTAI